MAPIKTLRKGIIKVKNKVSGTTPFIRGKVKVENVFNPLVKKAIYNGAVVKVVRRKDIDALVKLSKGRTELSRRAIEKLTKLHEDKVLVEERGLGKYHDNPHLEIMWFEKLTSPMRYVTDIKENSKNSKKR